MIKCFGYCKYDIVYLKLGVTMRKTKIICTIGPACQDEATLTKLCLSGMTVARFNFSHGTYESHRKVMETIKKVRKNLGVPLPIMLDTKGPEYRIGVFEHDRISLKDGDIFTFTGEEVIGNETIVSVNYKQFAKEMNVGDIILVNDGLISFRVIETDDIKVKCEVINGGDITNRKSMAFPDKVLHQAFLSQQDKKDLLFGIENGVDFIAASFVSNKENVLDMRNFLNANGGSDIDIIAKIENSSGLEKIEEICDVCEGVMVARGDLGVEIPFEKLPAAQKKLITACRMKGKMVITATEMLESMITKSRPTRAEISDVANAVYDGTSAVMLSGETAIGKHPIEAVSAMDAICKETEKAIDYERKFFKTDFQTLNTTDAVTHSACSMAMSVDAKAITVCTISGKSARMVSRFRPNVDIVGLTIDEKVWRKLALSWGVYPILSEAFNSVEVMFYKAAVSTAELKNLQKGDTIVVVGSTISGKSGSTNNIRLETI